MAKKRYAVCGVSNRGLNMFIGPLLREFSDHGEIVGFLDVDPKRFAVAAEMYPEAKGIPTFTGEDSFDAMVAAVKPDTVIVCGIDRTHVTYILKALAKDLNVISEKPMVTTAEDCRRVLEAEKKSKGKVTVTFNVRYIAECRAIKEMILAGKIGRLTHVDLNWYIDTHHGSSYFQRWNRERKNSGGLSIHKSTHHLDMVNWFVGQNPVEVFSYGARNYYGADGELNPKKVDGRRCPTCTDRTSCAYYMRWHGRSEGAQAPKDDHLGTVKASYTDYAPDRCIFDSCIDIEDTYVASIKYDKGALFSYSVNFSTPYEGFRLAINGTKGRIEWTFYGAPSRMPFAVESESTLDYMPLFNGGRERIDVLKGAGSHGGADPILREDLFIGPDPLRGYEIMSNSLAGAQAVAMGEALWRSAKEKRPISIPELLGMQ